MEAELQGQGFLLYTRVENTLRFSTCGYDSLPHEGGTVAHHVLINNR